MTNYAFFGYNRAMVSDHLHSIAKYRPLDEKLGSLRDMPAEELPVFHCYRTMKDNTVVFTVGKGSATASTSWRENPGSMEATAAVTLGAGDFVLFLPGEPFIVKANEEDAEISMRVLR